MNKVLLENIIKHILANLAIIPEPYVNYAKTKSLVSKEFLLPETLSFETESGEIFKNQIWGCQISADQQELKILLGDCSQIKEIPEYCLIVQLKNAPAYGMYLVYPDHTYAAEGMNSEALLACTMDGTDWMICQTYLQATFLAGMEQIKDMGMAWNKCSDYQDQYRLMTSFIKYHHNIYEAKYEGQED